MHAGSWLKRGRKRDADNVHPPPPATTLQPEHEPATGVGRDGRGAFPPPTCKPSLPPHRWKKAISVALIHSRAANYRPALRRAARHNPANHGAGRGVSTLWACQRAVPQHVPGAARLQTHPLGCKRGDEQPPCWGWSKQGPQKPCRAWCTQLWLQRGCKSPPLPPASARSAEPAAGAGGEGAGCSLQPLLGARRDNGGNHGMKGPSLVPAFPKTQMAHTRQLPNPELSIPASQPDG